MADYDDILAQVDGLIWPSDAALLYEHAHGIVVEIGSYRGRSTLVLARACQARGGLVYAIDPHLTYVDGPGGEGNFSDADAGAMLRNIVAFHLEDTVRIINLESAQALRGWQTPIDFLFVDGAHDYASARHDVTFWGMLVKRDGFMAVHDWQMSEVNAVIEEAKAGHWQEIARSQNMVILARKAYEIRTGIE